jgi:RNA polymerase sigma factor (sigma-70 family)
MDKDRESDDTRRIADHVGALRAYVRLRIGGAIRAREESADIAQSVVREALEDLPRFSGDDGGLRGWLLRRAENKIKDRGRFWKRERRDAAREIAADADADAGVLAECRSFLTPSRDVSAKEELERVERAFARLSEDQRRVILLARVAGLAHAEVAREMGRTELATRTLLSRAMARLVVLLEEDGSEPR